MIVKLRFVEETLLTGHKRYSTERSDDGVVWSYVGGSLSHNKEEGLDKYKNIKASYQHPTPLTVIEECTL